MVEVAQHPHLAQGAHTEHGVLEGAYLLDGDLHTRRPVHGRANDTVSAFANHFQYWILLRVDIEWNFAWAAANMRAGHLEDGMFCCYVRCSW